MLCLKLWYGDAQESAFAVPKVINSHCASKEFLFMERVNFLDRVVNNRRAI